MLTVAVGFEHQVGVSREAKQAWNGALRLLNILQFIPWIFVGCRDGIPLAPSIRPPEPIAVNVWAEIERLMLSGMLPLVDHLNHQSCKSGSE
jgi:DEAD/DEAH box helicase domain-containing protein